MVYEKGHKSVVTLLLRDFFFAENFQNSLLLQETTDAFSKMIDLVAWFDMVGHVH